jgi:hypothetical protein
MPKYAKKIVSVMGRKKTYQFTLHEMTKKRLLVLATLKGTTMSGYIESIVTAEHRRLEKEEREALRTAWRELFTDQPADEKPPVPSLDDLEHKPEVVAG